MTYNKRRLAKTQSGQNATILPMDKTSSPNDSKTLLTPDALPDPWLMDSEYLLGRLTALRELILRVPVSLATYGPTNIAVAAVWQLESDLRFMLRLHRDSQIAFRKQSKPELAQPEQPAIRHHAVA